MPKQTEFYVVLDANVIVRDFWLSGDGFSYLTTHQFLSHKPIIPEVAYQEARNQLKERAELLLASKDNGSPDLDPRLLRLFNYKRVPRNPDFNVRKLLERWDTHIRKLLEQFDGRIVATPTIEMTQIVQRSIQRQKPFSRGDRGFRDTLIWLSTLELVGSDTCVSFVSGNTKDFFSEGSAEPHPELAREAESKLSPDRKMLFHRSIDEFIANLDADRSASAEALQRALISDGLSSFSVWDWLELNVEDLLDYDDFDEIAWAGLPIGAEAPRLQEVEELISLDVPRISHLKDDIYRFYCDFSFVGHFACDIAFERAEHIVHPRQILRKNESDSFWTSVVVRSTATFMMRVDFDIKTRTVVTAFVRPLVHWQSYDKAIDDLEEMYRDWNDDLAEDEEDPSVPRDR